MKPIFGMIYVKMIKNQLTLPKKYFMKFLLITCLALLSFHSFAQDKSLGYFVKDTILNDTTVALDFNTKDKGSVKLIKDDRLEQITEFIGRKSESIEGSIIDGYRIQIFFAESRSTAQSQKAGFINTYKEHKAYIDYLAPNYRIRVGNFRTKLQAEKFKQELILKYPTSIVLEDKIELPVLSEPTETK